MTHVRLKLKPEIMFGNDPIWGWDDYRAEGVDPLTAIHEMIDEDWIAFLEDMHPETGYGIDALKSIIVSAEWVEDDDV